MDKSLGVRLETIKLEENIEGKFHDLKGWSMIPWVRPQKQRQQQNGKGDSVKLKIFCTAEKIINTVRRQLED